MKKLTEEQLFEIASGDVSRDAFGPLSAEDERDLALLGSVFGDLKALPIDMPEMQFSEDRLRHAIEAAGKSTPARKPFLWWWFAAPGLAAAALAVVMFAPRGGSAPLDAQAPVVVAQKDPTPVVTPPPTPEEAVESEPLVVNVDPAPAPVVVAAEPRREARPARRIRRERPKPMTVARLESAKVTPMTMSVSRGAEGSTEPMMASDEALAAAPAVEAVVVVQESEDRTSGVRGAVEVQKSNDVVIGS